MSDSSQATVQTRLVVCITGMPGAGKSTVAEFGSKLGFEIFRMGDDVRKEAEKRKVPPSDENLGAIMLELRQRNGPVAIAHLCKQRIESDSKSRYITIDGIRNMVEFMEFRKLGITKLVAVHASPDRRFKFLQTRARSDFPQSRDSFESRDRRELGVGVSEPIALADEVIDNSGTLDELNARAQEFFRTLKESTRF
ncbi:MAG: AAA family ATPase [Nitrososphaerales archaeon]